MGLMTAFYNSHYIHFFIFVSIGICLLLSYSIGGFVGVALTGIGVMCTPCTLIATNYLGAMSLDAFNMYKLANLDSNDEYIYFSINLMTFKNTIHI